MHSEKIRPPRALWVPFELGRPLGVPNDPEFQRRVLVALLGLLAEAQGPVLRDFPEEAPATDPNDLEGLVCPVSLAPSDGSDETLAERVRREVSHLEPWYELSRQRRGRTTYGATGLDLASLLSFLSVWLDGETPPSPIAGQSTATALKLASEDLKAFYLEAMQAQPSPKPSRMLYDWFWTEASAGKMLVAIRDVCLHSADRGIRDTAAGNLVPRAYFGHFGIEGMASPSRLASADAKRHD